MSINTCNVIASILKCIHFVSCLSHSSAFKSATLSLSYDEKDLIAAVPSTTGPANKPGNANLVNACSKSSTMATLPPALTSKDSAALCPETVFHMIIRLKSGYFPIQQ
jgi:hypothetical protein